MRVSLLLIGLLLVGLPLTAGANAAPAAIPASAMQLLRDFGVQLPHEHKPAPDFTLKALDGRRVSLSDFRGKLVLLHFWATWCAPCRDEMPRLHRIEKRLPAEAFRIICVNVDRGDSGPVRSFIREVSPSFQTLLDTEGEVRQRYAVCGLPTTYLIGRDGRIIGRIIGERDWTGADAMLQALLAEDAKEAK